MHGTAKGDGLIWISEVGFRNVKFQKKKILEFI
jgi:hypothetical protein